MKLSLKARNSRPLSVPAFTPTDVSDLSGWYDAGYGVTKDGSNRVSLWLDRTANINHLAQATEANQPLYVASSIGGQPAIRFDGSDDVLTMSRFFGFPALGDTPRAAFSVIKSNTTAFSFVFQWQWGGSNDFGFVLNHDTGKFSVYENTYVSSGIAVASGASKLLEATYASGSLKTYVNGVAGSTGTPSPPTTGTPSALYVGALSPGGFSFNGDISELLIFAKVPTTAERQALESYLMTKYGLS